MPKKTVDFEFEGKGKISLDHSSDSKKTKKTPRKPIDPPVKILDTKIGKRKDFQLPIKKK